MTSFATVIGVHKKFLKGDLQVENKITKSSPGYGPKPLPNYRVSLLCFLEHLADA